MSFTSTNGYIPMSIEALMDIIMLGVNAQFGTSYTTDTFLGTNFYKYFYALVQELQASEVKTSEIFEKVSQYFVVTNQRLFKPASTPEGIIDRLAEIGYISSVKKMINADAGKCSVCVQVDSGDPQYASKKLAINTVLKNCVVGGVVLQGTETSSITLTNGQSFDFKYSLPDAHALKLRLTIVISTNNTFTISTPEVTKQRLFDNIAARYKLGLNFEPQKYFTPDDAPWAASILLEWSTDGGSTYHSTVIVADFDDLYTIDLADISLVES
jgi:hypothetical protein